MWVKKGHDSGGPDGSPDGLETGPTVNTRLGGVLRHELHRGFGDGGDDPRHEANGLPLAEHAGGDAVVEQARDVAEDTFALDAGSRSDALGHHQLRHGRAQGRLLHAPVEVTIPYVLEALDDRGARGVTVGHGAAD